MQDQREISDELAKLIQLSATEVDVKQLAIFQKMSLAERFYLGCSASDTARTAVMHRMKHQRLELSLQQTSSPDLIGNES